MIFNIRFLDFDIFYTFEFTHERSCKISMEKKLPDKLTEYVQTHDVPPFDFHPFHRSS